MDAGFRVAALEEALARFGKPKILKTDQCSPFTSLAFTSVLREAEAVVRKLPDRLRLDLTSNDPTVRQSAEETVAMKIAAALGDAQSTSSEV